MPLNDDETFRKKRVTIMGLGSFGGGIGAARFIGGLGARVTITDVKGEESLRESIEALRGLGIRFVLGRHEMSDFTGADMVVVSPAVPRDSEFVMAARAAGAVLTTELGLFVERCPAGICGVTGSNGKTTTVSMLKSILEHTGERYFVGGNIGGSLLTELDRIAPGDRVVIEISSFQLEWLDELSWSPRIAAILNIMPNHLDRHGTFENYRDAKAVILTHQKPDDTTVLVRDDPGSAGMQGRVWGTLVWAGTILDGDGVTVEEGWIVDRRRNRAVRICELSRLLVPGKHNVLNALAASACALELGIGHSVIGAGLASFRGVPHRLEYLGERSGVLFFNDSKATTPEAAAAAVASFGQPVIPILGGYDKGMSFEAMTGNMAGRVRWAALIGETAERIEKELQRAGIPSKRFQSLAEAFNGCMEHACQGDIVVLSPGCASYDMFNNYEERGGLFREIVKRYIESTA